MKTLPMYMGNITQYTWISNTQYYPNITYTNTNITKHCKHYKHIQILQNITQYTWKSVSSISYKNYIHKTQAKNSN